MESESITLTARNGALVPYKPLLPPEDVVAVAATKHVRARLRYAIHVSHAVRVYSDCLANTAKRMNADADAESGKVTRIDRAITRVL